MDKGKKLEDSSKDFQFAAAVAGFGMLLRASKFSGNANWKMVNNLGKSGMGADLFGYRREFLQLANMASKEKPDKGMEDVLAPAH